MGIGTRLKAVGYRPVGVAALLLALALTGCTGGGGSHTASSSSTTTANHASGSPTTTTSVSVPHYDPAKNARKDVSAGLCVNVAGKGWSFQGTVTNSTAAPRGYSIVVDFVTTPGDTVQATRLVNVPSVAPAATAKWSVDSVLPGQKGLTCVVRQALTA